MILALLIALSLIAVSVAAVVSVISEPRLRRAENLEQIDAYGYVASHQPVAAGSQVRTTLDTLAAAIGGKLAHRLRSLREDEIQARLLAAGFFTVGPRKFLGYQVLLTIGLPLVIIWLLLAAGASPVVTVFLALIGFCLGLVGPGFLLGHRRRMRLQEIDRGLPELTDLLVVTLEAGVGFSAALRLAGERFSGPLGDELRLTAQEQNLGLSTLTALENWLERTDTPAVRSFVTAMVQGERLGVSVGHILRNLAVETRRRQRQAIEEQAHKAPIKILFPLVLFIFPAMFVVLIGPMVYRIGTLFSS